MVLINKKEMSQVRWNSKAPLMIPLLLLLLAFVCAQPAESRPFLDSIPGVRLLRSITGEAMGVANELMGEVFGQVAASGEKIKQLCRDELSCPPHDDDTNRNVSQIITSRGFLAQEYDVITKDGYILTIQRIVNPLVSLDYRPKMRPVIMQHGLMSSSADFVINSRIVRPTQFPPPASSSSSNNNQNVEEEILGGDSQEHPNALGFYLANQGYDVFLANSRGNLYGQRHVNMSSWQPKFWSFTFDEQIAYDLPDTIEFVQRLTNHTKVGYVGHSQGTTMILGLLSERPEMANVVEPVVLLAPVAYVNHCLSPVKYFAVYTPIFKHINWSFATNNAVIKYLGPIVCGPKVIRKDICENIIFLSLGFDEAELEDERVAAYLSHMPSGTSVKNVAHWGQMVLSGRFSKFDHGLLANQVRYKQTKAPDYKLANIKSKSLVLFHAENDWLASPKDVAHLKQDLTVQPFAVYNVTELKPKWNHADFVYAKSAGQIINTRIHEVLEHFRSLEEQE